MGVAAVVGGGIVLRAAYVVLVLDPVPPGLDAIWYSLQGGSIRSGTGYVVPTSLFAAERVPTAGFPPGYPLYQALWQAAVGNGPTTVRLAGLLPGAATLTLVAVLGRRVVSPRVGLLAAALVALSPSLIAVDGSAMSENLTVPLVLAVLLVGHRVLTRGCDLPWVVLLGALCGAAALTRQDLVLLVGLVALPVTVGSRHAGRPGRIGAGVLVIAVAALVVVPWAWRNHQSVGSFTISTLSPSSALAGANCDATYAGADLGSWRFSCVQDATPPPEARADEVAVAEAQREAAIDHATDHLARLPLVAAARQARVWGAWDPRDLARRDAEESRRYGWQLVARPLDLATTVVGMVGLVELVRRRRPRGDVLLLWAPVVVAAVSAVVGYGNPRFGAIARPVLLIGVAAVIVGLVDRARIRRRHHPGDVSAGAAAADSSAGAGSAPRERATASAAAAPAHPTRITAAYDRGTG